MKRIWLALVVVLGASAVGVFHHGKQSQVVVETQRCHGSYLHACGDLIPATKLAS